MLTENNLKNITTQLIVMTAITTLILFSQTSKAETLSGPEFSDPSDHAVITKEWFAKKIKYDSKSKNADLVLALGQQTHPIFHKLIQQYAKDHNLKIAITQGTCGITAGKLLRKKVDMGAYCCPPGKTDRLPGLKFHSLGISPIALIVHPDNPIKNLTTDQARNIFRGQISRWSDISATHHMSAKQIIRPVGRLHCKIRPGHWRGLLKDEDLFSSRLGEVGVISDMISKIGRDSRAIGYEVPLMVSFHKSKGNVRMINIDNHAPTDVDYVLSGRYPLYRTYHLTTWDNDRRATKLANELIVFLRNHIEENYSRYGFIPPSKLKLAGWKFRGDELIGEPVK